MARGKRLSPEQIVVMLRQIEVQLAQANAWHSPVRRPASPSRTPG